MTTSAEMATVKKHKIISIGKDVMKAEPLYTICGHVKWYSCFEKHFNHSSNT